MPSSGTRWGESQLSDDPDATEVQRGMHRQHRADAQSSRDLVRDCAAEDAAQGAGALNLAEPLFGRSRIEPVRGDEPERRPKQRTQTRNVQINQHGGKLRSLIGQDPFGQEQCRAGGK